MNITYSARAIKAIAKLDGFTKQRVKTAMEKLPSGDVKKLKGYSNSYRLRVGEYRVLFDMNGAELQVTDILPRDKAYKK